MNCVRLRHFSIWLEISGVFGPLVYEYVRGQRMQFYVILLTYAVFVIVLLSLVT